MARGATVASSLPAVTDDVQDEDLMAQQDEQELEVDEEQAILDEEARAEGYENHQDKVDTEKLARVQGWRPLAEFQGRPGTHKTAKQFIEDGKNFLPFVQRDRDQLREQVGRMTSEIEGLRGELATTRADMQKMLEFSRRAGQQAYDRAVAELEAKARDAVQAGDVATYDQVQDQLGKMEEAREEVVPEPQRQPPPRQEPAKGKIDAQVQAFVDANPWAMTDPVLNAAMIAAENYVKQKAPGISNGIALERAKEIVMGQYPEKFGLPEKQPVRQPVQDPPRRQPAAPLAPSGRQPVRQTAKTGIDSIVDGTERAEARKSYNRYLVSMPDLKEAEFMDIWNDPHADVLEVRRRHRQPKG